jgi:hypothetical protein
MQNRHAIIKAALVMGISTFALAACDTGDWFEDDATYAGDVKPPVETTETAAATNQVVPPPSQEILQTLPQASPQPTPQFTSSLPGPTSTEAPPAPPVTNAYTGNLASVPPRPAASELPTAEQVVAARQELVADNQKLTSTLKDPNAAMTPPVYQPVATPVIPPAPQPIQQPAAYAPPVPQPMTTPQPMYAPPVVAQPLVQQPAVYAPPAVPPPAPTDQNVSGRMLGLQSSGPGKYSLVQLQPDTGIGSFAMVASIATTPPANQINIVQYQDLRRVAAQYDTQKGRVRLVAYSKDPQSQEALQRATTVAAYLIDLGVPATSIRLRIDPAPADATQALEAARKTDIFLETPVTTK